MWDGDGFLILCEKDVMLIYYRYLLHKIKILSLEALRNKEPL